jgi:hypothetical protein
MVWWAKVLGTSVGLVHGVALQAGDEPGRVAQDAAGLVHVALRRAGAVATIDLAAGTVVRRTPVCPAPRGLAYDASYDALTVACVGGELVTIAAEDGTLLRSVQLDPDLRDVVPLGYGGFLAVSTFRKAEVLLVDPTGAISSRTRPIPQEGTLSTCAWRMVAIPGETGVAIAHQTASRTTVSLASTPVYYIGGGIVNSAVTLVKFVGPPGTKPALDSLDLPGGLPVDLAFDNAGDSVIAALYASQAIYATPLTDPNFRRRRSIGTATWRT